MFYTTSKASENESVTLLEKIVWLMDVSKKKKKQ